MRPFDISEAKAGKPVCTRDGRKVRILCFDKASDSGLNIVALVPCSDRGKTHEICEFYTIYGQQSKTSTSRHDLVMATVKKEGWVILCRILDDTNQVVGPVWSSLEDANDAFNVYHKHDGVAVCKIEWEE